MLIACDNKGCLKQSTALLNTDSLEVICGDCGKPIASVSEPMKRTLKSFGQIMRTEERRAFMMACKACNANREVILDDKNNTVCKICKSAIGVHAAMKQAIMEVGRKLSSLEKETVDEESTDEAPKAKVKKTRKVKKNI